MRDFTLTVYRRLLLAFSNAGYGFLPFRDYVGLDDHHGRLVVLRHDVDRIPSQAVDMALVENDMEVSASYYFRIVSKSFDSMAINRIAEMGHEIGYHYEDLTLARGDMKRAVALFERNLEILRSLQPVSTICMHGSPLTRWDNRLIWEEIDYRSYGLIGEPYFDIDFESVMYVTDTGRSWNDERYSRRDRVGGGTHEGFRSTYSLIDSVRSGDLPNVVMINTHPQRWTDKRLSWTREWLAQSLKNPVKYVLNRATVGR